MVRLTHKSAAKTPPGGQIGYQEIARVLRKKIITGQWPAGRRLPTRRDLGARFRTTPVTVHNALSMLQEHGFVRSAGRLGSFVCDHPPHLCAYGLVFPHLFVDTRFFRALRAAARVVFDSESHRLCEYEFNVNNAADPANLRLFDDVTYHRLAGMIITWPTGVLSGTPLSDPGSGVPGVVIGHYLATGARPTLGFNMPDFYERAVDRLVARGRRKIAHLGVGDQENYTDPLTPILRRRGLECRPHWHVPLGVSRFSAARPTAHLLAALPPDDRPDGLIISDDNLVEHAQAGLAASGIKISQDLDVIAHCNWPRPPAAILPLAFLGFDCTGMMRTCTRLINQQRRGETLEQSLLVGPLFEEELPAASRKAVPSESAVEIPS